MSDDSGSRSLTDVTEMLSSGLGTVAGAFAASLISPAVRKTTPFERIYGLMQPYKVPDQGGGPA